MKIKIISMILLTFLSVNTFAAQKINWLLYGINYELMVANDSDVARQLTVHANRHRIIGGDVLVTPNDISLMCDGSFERTIAPGEEASCNLQPHSFATLTIIPSGSIEWGAEGTYVFSDIQK